MATHIKPEPPGKLELPGFMYRNFEVPSIDLSASLIENPRSDKYVHELAAASAPLQWRVALYHVGRGLAWGGEEAQRLPEAVRKAGRDIYENAQQCRAGTRAGEGTFHNDAVYIYPKSHAPKGWVQPYGDYRFGIYLKGIEGFEQKDGVWEPKLTPETKEIRLWVPEGNIRFIVPTSEGAYHPETGTPLATEANREKALKLWMEAGLSAEQARNELSIAYRRNEGLAAPSPAGRTTRTPAPARFPRAGLPSWKAE